MDLCLRSRDQVFAVELKTWREGQADPVPEGLEQLDRNFDALALQTGWLVVFDQRRSRAPVGERTVADDARPPTG
jgi:hypothetical protein